jgi:ribosomal protein S18 acetylase RimI-like enzyme
VAQQKATVRVMKQEDMPAVVEIDSMAQDSPRSEYLQTKLVTGISMVAEMDTKIVGFVMGAINRGEFGIPEKVATIDTVGVHPEFQNAGVGRVLIEEFVNHTRQAGAQRIRTLVDWSRQWDIMGYFRSSGFTPAGSSIVLERKI